MRYGYLLDGEARKNTITADEYEEIRSLAEGALWASTKLKAKPYVKKLMVKCTFYYGDLYKTCSRLISTAEAAADEPKLKRLYQINTDVLLKEMRSFITEERGPDA